jgi:hypothetical protein
VMRNCVTLNNGGHGYELYLTLGPRSTAASLRFENCKSSGDSVGTSITAPGSTPGGSISFEGCAFERSRGSAIVVADKPSDGTEVRFADCSIVDPQNVPILLTSGPDAANAIGGLVFANCLVRDDRERKPMDFVDRGGGSRLRDISGSLEVEKEGQHTTIRLTEKVIADWMPAAVLKPIPRLTLAGMVLTPVAEKYLAVPASSLGFVRLRKDARLVLYASQGDTVVFRLRHLPVANYSGETIPVIVVSPSGSEVTRVGAPFKLETEVTFVAPETGVYRISTDPDPNVVEIPVSSHPMNLSGDGQPINFHSTTGELFFWVPAGATTFGVRVFCDDGEAIKAALVDPGGQVVEEADNITAAHQFEVTLPGPSAGEAWSIRLSMPTKLGMDDEHVDLRGIPPLLAGSRNALLRPRA